MVVKVGIYSIFMEGIFWEKIRLLKLTGGCICEILFDCGAVVWIGF